MTETYDININRNEDAVLYRFPYFNINVTLSGEKMDTDPVTPEPEPENFKLITLTPTYDITNEIPSNSTVYLQDNNSNNIFQCINTGTSLSSLPYKMYVQDYRPDTWGSSKAYDIKPQDNSTTISTGRFLLFCTSSTNNNEFYISLIDNTGGTYDTTIQWPKGTTTKFVFKYDVSYISGLSTKIPNYFYDPDALDFKIQFDFRNVISDNIYTFYKIDFPFNPLSPSSYQPFIFNSTAQAQSYSIITNQTLSYNGMQLTYLSNSTNCLINWFETDSFTTLNFQDVSTLGYDTSTWNMFLMIEKSKYNRIFWIRSREYYFKQRLDPNYPFKRLYVRLPRSTGTLKLTEDGTDQTSYLVINVTSGTSTDRCFSEIFLPDKYSIGYIPTTNLNFSNLFGTVLFTNKLTNSFPVISGTPTTSGSQNAVAVTLTQIEPNYWIITNGGNDYYDITSFITISLDGETLFKSQLN